MANRGGATRPNGSNAGNKICQFKLVLLGESAVGKSSLVLRFVKGQFHEFQESTIGGRGFLYLNVCVLFAHVLNDFSLLLPAAFLTQTVCLDDTTVKFEIWDTAGQERYHSLAPMYYRGAQAAIVVYDITNEVSSFVFKALHECMYCLCSASVIVPFTFFTLKESFARAKNWVKELQRQASPNIVIALSGNKADLANKRAVDFQVHLTSQQDQREILYLTIAVSLN